MINRKKSTLQIDLKTEEGVQKIREQIQEYDILIEGFRPGIMRKFGLGYEELAKLNPSLIYCSLTGYGQDGPYAQRAGHDINYLGLAGIPNMGDPDIPNPHNLQIADIAGGSLHTVIAILTAYIHRLKTGNGKNIDVAMYDASISLNFIDILSFLSTGEEPTAGNGLLTGGTIYNYYRTRDGGYLSIGSLEPKFRTNLFRKLGIEKQGKSELDLASEIKDIIAANDLDYWLSIFTDNDTCVEPVLKISEILKHPQFKHRGLLVSNDSEVGPRYFIQNPIKFSSGD